jgi:type I restriction enzyme R subunit
VYLETAKQLQEKIDKNEAVIPEVEQLDFEFVLFASTVVDYDYIMTLILKCS